MKALIFVSPGRCGTRRLAELLKEKLPNEFTVKHQMRFSRAANVIGNVMYHFGQSEKIKEKLYYLIVSNYVNNRYFISCDPLTAMIIPQKWIESDNVSIVQITRDPGSFADSFLQFSREKMKSMVAHNLIPCWQIGVYPFENFFSRNKIKKKYKYICKLKENFFEMHYSSNPNYFKVDMNRLYKDDFLEQLLDYSFQYHISITKHDLSIRKNQTKKRFNFEII